VSWLLTAARKHSTKECENQIAAIIEEIDGKESVMS
jgi:hypothetical protein